MPSARPRSSVGKSPVVSRADSAASDSVQRDHAAPAGSLMRPNLVTAPAGLPVAGRGVGA